MLILLIKALFLITASTSVSGLPVWNLIAVVGTVLHAGKAVLSVRFTGLSSLPVRALVVVLVVRPSLLLTGPGYYALTA